MDSKKRVKGLYATTRVFSLVAFIVSALTVIAAVVLFVAFLLTEKKILVLISSIIFVLYVAFMAFGVFLALRASSQTIAQNLFERTKENYNRLANLKQNLVYYDQENVKEFQELNEKIDEVNKTFNKTVFTNVDHVYQYLDLEYIDDNDQHLISLNSFIKHHKHFILNGEAFRNAFVFFNFEVKDEEEMEEDFYKLLYNNIKDEFSDVNYLVAKDEKRYGFLVFLPNIDSLSYFRERLVKIAHASIVSKHEAGGTLVMECHASAVIYPYSDIEDILPDLRYAIRQGKAINIYMPERLNKSDIQLYHTSLNHNNISKIFEQLAKESIKIDDYQKATQAFQKVLKQLGEHIGFETVGIGLYDEHKAKFLIDYENTRSGFEPIFAELGEIHPEFVEALIRNLDADGSYFFSRRRSVNEEIGKYLDLYGIESGFFAVVLSGNKPRTIIYYLNKTITDFTVTSYDRESLVIFSNSIASFSKQVAEESETRAAERRYRSVLRLTDTNIYVVHHEDYTLYDLSDGLMDATGQFERGEKCYKHIYGLDEPCKDCPLAKSGKKLSMIGKREYETSMILNRRKEEYPTLLMAPINEDSSNKTFNRYDPQLLIHSFYGLTERMNNLFLTKNRGYVLFLSVDNYDTLLEKYGEEGYQNRLRFFFKNYRLNKKFGEGEVYVYSADKFAIVLPEEGRVDILNRSETIYNISTMKYDEKDPDEERIKCTYIGFEYPASYNNVQEFFRNVNRYYKDNYKLLGEENFILPDTDYIRVVSRERFILSLLDEGIKGESLSLKYLPEVKSPANKITGAEILLRLTDKYRNEVLSPFEFIPVASRNNKIGTITNYLVARVGETYQKYGYSAFKLAGLRSFSLNIDTTYFEDEDFLKQIESLINRFHFQKGFLRFEFNESDIAEHYELMKTAAKKLINLDITLTVDGYTGKYISIEKLKDLGFSIIKISRQFILDFAQDQSRLSAIKLMVNSIKEFNLHYCFVGVENKLQYQMLQEVDEEFYAQGYYYYQPMDIDVLLDKLRLSVE